MNLAQAYQPSLFPRDKRCSKCGEVKPLAEFWRDKNGKDGYEYRCKACARAYRPPMPDTIPDAIKCRTCGISKPLSEFSPRPSGKYGKMRHCKACRAVRRRAYVDARRDEVNERQRQAIIRGGDEMRAKRRAYMARTREHRLALQQAERDKTRDERRARHDAKMAAKREVLKARTEKPCWRCHVVKPLIQFVSDPRRIDGRGYLCYDCRVTVQQRRPVCRAKQRVYNAKRRALLEQAEGTYTVADIARLYDNQDASCFYCHVHLTRLHVDHKTPLSRGGSNWPANLCLTCPRCNVRKCDKTAEEFIAYLAAFYAPIVAAG